MDYGKFRFEQSKREREIRKNQKGIRILALYQGGKQAQIKYYLFWKKANTNNYIKDFANVILEAFRPQKNAGN